MEDKAWKIRPKKTFDTTSHENSPLINVSRILNYDLKHLNLGSRHNIYLDYITRHGQGVLIWSVLTERMRHRVSTNFACVNDPFPLNSMCNEKFDFSISLPLMSFSACLEFFGMFSKFHLSFVG